MPAASSSATIPAIFIEDIIYAFCNITQFEVFGPRILLWRHKGESELVLKPYREAGRFAPRPYQNPAAKSTSAHPDVK
jgi:hypothetical protein